MADGDNVVLIILDTTRVDDLKRAKTPHLDDISDTGIAFRRAFANAPWTLPSHATLLTGVYPRTHGAHAAHKRFESDLRRLPEAFASAGYETMAVSNNPWFTEEFGFDRGFDTFYKSWQLTQSRHDFRKVFLENTGLDLLYELVKHTLTGNTRRNIANAAYEAYSLLSDKRSDKGAVKSNAFFREWLTDRKETDPFFVCINYLEPHLEYRPPADLAEKYLPEDVSYEEAMEIPQDPWGYVCEEFELTPDEFEILHALHLAEVEYTDQRVGELVSALKSADVLDETHLVVTSDHGENIGDHGLIDHIFSLHDTLTHVPLIMSDAPSSVDGRSLVEHVDLVPTLLDRASIDDPLREQAAGHSLYSEVVARKAVISELVAPQPSMAQLEERYTVPESVRIFDRGLTSIRTSDAKLVAGTDGSEELYSVGDDPTAEARITDDGARADLRSRLADWEDRTPTSDHSGEVEITEGTQQRLEDLGYI